MSFEVKTTDPFERKFKRLAKKYRSLHSDLSPVIDQLSIDPSLGIPVGKNCYKIRLAIASKGKGKSGGARLITYVMVARKTVFLLDIFDKSEQADISDVELAVLVSLISNQ